jgi:hypothetical protein
MILAACDVLPLAFGDEKWVVDLPRGKFVMKGEILTLAILRPSSARTFTAWGSVTTISRPSPG